MCFTLQSGTEHSENNLYKRENTAKRKNIKFLFIFVHEIYARLCFQILCKTFFFFLLKIIQFCQRNLKQLDCKNKKLCHGNGL